MKRAAVILAGILSLAATVQAKECPQRGFSLAVVEAQADIPGVWLHLTLPVGHEPAWGVYPLYPSFWDGALIEQWDQDPTYAIVERGPETPPFVFFHVSAFDQTLGCPAGSVYVAFEGE